MFESISRRTFSTLATGLLATATSTRVLARDGGAFAPRDTDSGGTELAELEARHGGRLGVFAVDTGSGSRRTHRADERFPMCSTHKVLVGAAILSMVEQGRLRFDQRVPYGPSDILEYAPVTKKNVTAGFMTVESLCEAAVRWSDNTADNLLLKLLGGPAGWTRYARETGDKVSRLDRFEPDLNSSLPGDPRDTSSPSSMTRTLATLMFGNALGDPSRSRLKTWMLDSEITATLLRAGLPAAWHVADKSGSGSNGSRNDIGVLYPPSSAPIVVSVFYTGSQAPIAEREKVIAQAAGIIASRFS